MKFTPSIPCQCGNHLVAEAVGKGRFSIATCSNCHEIAAIFDHVNFGLISGRILGRSHEEIRNGDFTLAILMSTMAVECELSDLFFRWRIIDHRMADHLPVFEATQKERTNWEEEYAKLFGIKKKLDYVSSELTGEKFDEFLQLHKFSQEIEHKYPESAKHKSITQFFQEQLFNVRNEIVHSGKVDYEESDAQRCQEIAEMIMNILRVINDEKYRRTFPTLLVEAKES